MVIFGGAIKSKNAGGIPFRYAGDGATSYLDQHLTGHLARLYSWDAHSRNASKNNVFALPSLPMLLSLLLNMYSLDQDTRRHSYVFDQRFLLLRSG